MDLFVPGRICLFGEHSDWAGGYRRINGALEKGYAIIAGTNQVRVRAAAPPGARGIAARARGLGGVGGTRFVELVGPRSDAPPHSHRPPTRPTS